MLILNILPLIGFYVIDHKKIKEVIAFGFFYMTIWVLIPCLLGSLTLYIYHKKHLKFDNVEMKKHWKIVFITVLSFIAVISNAIIYLNLT